MPNYANITKNNNPSADAGGYKNVFIFARRKDFLSISKPPAIGTIAGVTIGAGGTGYTIAPLVVFSGGGGSGAKGVATLTADAVTAITITDPGYGYEEAPTVSFVGGGGTGATATANVLLGNPGDELTVADAHTFTSPAGFQSWECQTNSVTITGTTVGEDGAAEMEFTGKFVVLGDSASTQSQMQRILNDDIIGLFKEASCLDSDNYVQLGDECVSPVFKVDYDGKTTKEGKKIYTVSVVCKRKYFYNQAVTFAS